MSDVLRTVGVHARRTGANVEIYGSENPYFFSPMPSSARLG